VKKGGKGFKKGAEKLEGRIQSEESFHHFLLSFTTRGFDKAGNRGNSKKRMKGGRQIAGKKKLEEGERASK